MQLKQGSISKRQRADDVNALTAAIYGEARNQNTLGKTAVAYTAKTRAELAGVPVSDVVYGSVTPKYGQYSFANPLDPNAKTVANAPTQDPEGWAEAQRIAEGVIDGTIENPVPGATNYAADYVSPKWAKSAEELGAVDDHNFYSLPSQEVAGVVSSAASSPYRRASLVDAGYGTGTPGTYLGPDQIEGEPRSISIGEFDFSGPREQRGFGRMNAETQFTASEIARTLPEGQDMTITATHGQHGLGNLTHTPGAAFDVRTRDLTEQQTNDLVDSTLYSRPESIGWNDGTGPFAKHMHVDTNAGYGVGLQSHSSLGGLSNYAKGELQRYDEAMKAGTGYAPPVPSSIAPVPSFRPDLPSAPISEIARNPFEVSAPEVAAAAPSTFSPVSPDGVPVHSVQTTTISPTQGTEVAATTPETISAQPEQSFSLGSFSPIGTAYAGTPTQATASVSIPAAPDVADLSVARNPFDVQVSSLPAPTVAAQVPTPAPTVAALPAPVEVKQYTVAAPKEKEATSGTLGTGSKITASGADVWGGKAAEGIATDGSKLTRNPDGSVSRYSSLSGKTEKISDAVSGWSGPSVGDVSQSTGGFWSSKADENGTLGSSSGGLFGGSSGGGFFGGLGNALSGIGKGISDAFGSLFGGGSSGGGMSQEDKARANPGGGLY